MPRLTKAEKEAAELARAEEAMARRLEFEKTIPTLLLNLIHRANELGVQTRTAIVDKTPAVTFTRDENPYVNTTLGNDSEEWEFADLDVTFDGELQRRAKLQADSMRALEIWNAIPVEDRELLRRFYLKA